MIDQNELKNLISRAKSISSAASESYDADDLKYDVERLADLLEEFMQEFLVQENGENNGG